MEVNKSEALAAVASGGKRSPGRHHPDGSDNEDDDTLKDDQTRRDAFQVDGALEGTISPHVQQMLSDLAGQLEPLRKDLERAHARERDLRSRLERHPYLPVLNRQGLEHELSRVVGHIEGLGTAAFICISVVNAEQIRREHGRGVYEEAMTHACRVVEGILGSADMVGCLGGHDLGVLLLAPKNDPVEHLASRMQSALSLHLFASGQSVFPLEVAVGGVLLHPGYTFVQALQDADLDMKDRLIRR